MDHVPSDPNATKSDKHVSDNRVSVVIPVNDICPMGVSIRRPLCRTRRHVELNIWAKISLIKKAPWNSSPWAYPTPIPQPVANKAHILDIVTALVEAPISILSNHCNSSNCYILSVHIATCIFCLTLWHKNCSNNFHFDSGNDEHTAFVPEEINMISLCRELLLWNAVSID